MVSASIQVDRQFARQKQFLENDIEIARKEFEGLTAEYKQQQAFYFSTIQWLEKAQLLGQVYPDHRLRRITDIHGLLERHYRCPMFHLAARYWEGRWLQEMDRVFEEKEKPGGQSRGVVERRFRRWAMLTPCFIATMHTAPRIFTYYDGQEQPLLDFIDMLIVDEAGQVSPEIGGPAFALAKRAVVVGHICQIEPVWSAILPVDRTCLEQHGLIPEDVRKRGASSASGSIMTLAGHASAASAP